MSKLIYFMPTSLDGFLASEGDDMDWSVPDEEIAAFINERMRPVGTYLIGRKMYETMKIWQTPEDIPGPLTPATSDYAHIWQAADKIVYSRSLAAVSTPRTRLEQEFDPQAVRALKSQLPHDLAIEGPNLAAQAFRAGLIDEVELLIVPKILGHGNPVLPRDVNLGLELLDVRHLSGGWVFLRYRTQA